MSHALYLGVLHYHFLRSGVRTVISNALRSLIAYADYDNLELDLISSDARQKAAGDLVEELLDFSRQHGPTRLQINQVEIPQLAYDQNPAPSRAALFDRANHLADHLLELMNLNRCTFDNPYILHPHNANLGKNPCLTLALKLLVDRLDRDNLPAWLLYQVHDFAEDNRPACWQALRDCTGSPDPDFAAQIIYPPSRRIHWLCLNSADRQKLLSTNLPQGSVSVLPNSISVDTFTAPPLTQMTPQQLDQLNLSPGDFAADLKNRIALYARNEGFRFGPSRKIILSPIKALRRKNITESVLLLMILNSQHDDYQILITLPPNSPADIEYSHAVADFVKQHRLPVVMDFGSSLLPLGPHRRLSDGKVIYYSLIDLLSISHAVVTTSIQEGFGYVFHEPWLAGKFVFGRNIPHLTCDFQQQGLNLSHLYDHLLIPLDWLDSHWKNLVTQYCQKINQMYLAQDLAPPDDSELAYLVEQKKTVTLLVDKQNKQKSLDWADLNLPSQLHILHILADRPALLDRILPTNSSLETISSWYPSSQSDIIKQNSEVVSSQYDLKTQASRLTSLFELGNRVLQSRPAASAPAPVTNKPLLESSLRIENIRLLT